MSNYIRFIQSKTLCITCGKGGEFSFKDMPRSFMYFLRNIKPAVTAIIIMIALINKFKEILNNYQVKTIWVHSAI